VGSAGRPDLLGIERADSLARLQYLSVNRLAKLPDHIGLYPTHGEGSFCTVSGAGRTTSTIGEERKTNPVLAYGDADAFVAGQLAILQPYPSYYQHMGPANVAGGGAIPEVDLPVLDADSVAAMSAEVQLVDIRDRRQFAAGYIPGSLGVELRDDFGVWVGWLVDIDQPLVLIADPDQDVDEARFQLARIGYDRVRGVMHGVSSWRDSGRPIATHEALDISRFSAGMADGAWTLDVRAPVEWENGHLEDSHHVYLPDIEAYPFHELERGDEVWVVCATGYRANIAAGILEQKGLRPVVLADGGVTDLMQRSSVPIASATVWG
jgi:rhodanese-related sulfurtransferase